MGAPAAAAAAAPPTARHPPQGAPGTRLQRTPLPQRNADDTTGIATTNHTAIAVGDEQATASSAAFPQCHASSESRSQEVSMSCLISY